MKDGEKKVWFTLLIVVLCAVVIGICYWVGNQETKDSEGYLVEASVPDTNVEVTIYGI